MSWHLHQVDFQLYSPLHIGERKIGTNLQITRRYVPARNMWAALTERLARCGFKAEGLKQDDYAGIGAWVQQHMAFSYWYIADESGMQLDWTEAVFERRYLASHLSTAIGASTGAAQDESLHEVEFLSPRAQDTGEGTLLRGWVMLDAVAEHSFAGDSMLSKMFGDIWLGGERRYGFGHLHLTRWKSDQSLSGYAINLDGARPVITVDREQPVLAHVVVIDCEQPFPANAVADDVPEMWGSLELFVGRETTSDGHFGRRLTASKICWMPGSRAKQNSHFEILGNGFWRFKQQ